MNKDEEVCEDCYEGVPLKDRKKNHEYSSDCYVCDKSKKALEKLSKEFEQ